VIFDERTGFPREGEMAPEFSALLDNGSRFSLADYREKSTVVLVFYPKDFTPGCTKQLCQFRDNYDALVNMNAVMIGISYDSADSHRKFADVHRLPFPLIADSDRAISRRYGTERFLGAILGSKRATFVIDKRGILRKVAHHEFAVGNHVEDVIETLRMLEQEEVRERSEG
jgi:thioredoxin-dependent peroxiredoxin